MLIPTYRRNTQAILRGTNRPSGKMKKNAPRLAQATKFKNIWGTFQSGWASTNALLVGRAAVPKVSNANDVSSAIQSFDLRANIANAIAEYIKASNTSSATLYPA